MKPVFDESGLAITAGDIRCFYYDSLTFEYTGWSDEYIHVGVSMPGRSTDIDPGDKVAGEVSVFKNGMWVREADHRGEVVYSTADGMASTVDYIGEIKPGFTKLMPVTRFDKWDGEKWVTDADAQHSAAVDAAEARRQSLIGAAMDSISLIQLKLRAGRNLTQEEKTRLNSVLDYIDAVEAIDTSNVPDIEWPVSP